MNSITFITMELLSDSKLVETGDLQPGIEDRRCGQVLPIERSSAHSMRDDRKHREGFVGLVSGAKTKCYFDS